MPRPCPITSAEGVELIGLYESGVSRNELARRFGASRPFVNDFLKRSGVTVRTLREACCPVLRDDVFDNAEADEEAAYWAGFLMADGCISYYHSRPAIIIVLHRNDADHIAKFLRFVGADIQPYDVKPGPRSGPCSRCTVYSERLVESLSLYGVVPKKSATAEVSRLEMNRHFWRGVVDGDGCLDLTVPRGSLAYPRLRLQVVGSQPLVTQFGAFAKSTVGSGGNAYKSHGCWGFSLHSNMAGAMISTLYTDCSVALRRKWAKAHELLCHWALRPAA